MIEIDRSAGSALIPVHWSGLKTRVMSKGITSVDSFEIDLP